MSILKSHMFRSYRPWGEVRRKSLIARVFHVALMTVLGLGIMAALALTFVFAASLALVGIAAAGVMALVATFMRKPVRIFVRSREPKADGVLEARKEGSTWTVY